MNKNVYCFIVCFRNHSIINNQGYQMEKLYAKKKRGSKSGERKVENEKKMSFQKIHFLILIFKLLLKYHGVF